MIDLSRTRDREHLLLASYATFGADTAGRRHRETEHAYRGPYARDRDRILHSSAFRRLAGKMQVFTGEMGTYHRTRLTHTFEVASVARTLARTLRLNEDLTEALALMHDIGHPPYGHCGEDVLAECLQNHGGFSHNRFALAIVEELEQRYDHFVGLNLSAETLSGQDARADKAAAAVGEAPRLEVQVVDAADSIAYDAHDVDDAMQIGLLTMGSLWDLAIVQRAVGRIRDRGGVVPRGSARQGLVHELLELQVSDLLTESSERLRPWAGCSCDQIRRAGVRIGHTETIARERDELEAFLFEAVYRHPKLMPVRDAAAGRLRELFDHLATRPERLPLRFRRRAETHSPVRAAGDYLAGMTDAFCDEQHARLTRHAGGPLADW